ncbi:MAG: RNA polymerase sigma factor, partial [Acidimicrobiales bacterium]
PERAAPGDDRAVAETELWEALDALPAKQRAAVAYHHLAGLPYAEVAEILGGTAGAARRAAADGIASLRKALNPSKSTGEPA